MNHKTFAEAFPATIPVLVGYLAIGLAFGLMLQSAGYGAGWAFLSFLSMGCSFLWARKRDFP